MSSALTVASPLLKRIPNFRSSNHSIIADSAQGSLREKGAGEEGANSPCPGRGAAFTLLRRAGTYVRLMDPGSAAHHHNTSKARVNALVILRSVRGTCPLTPNSIP